MKKDKPKRPKPSQRRKKRYICFRIDYENHPIKRKDLISLIWNSVLQTIGELGMGESELKLISFDEEKQEGILRCNHYMVDHVRFSLSLISKINDGRVAINVLGISGTIRSAREKFLGKERSPISQT
ncbi:MAG: Rpp14/Pop5 family protein [Candidatus Hydrothermarchaeota archaeon]